VQISSQADPLMKNGIPRRRFGRTEISMPVFSCGGMRYQHSWQDGGVEGVTQEGQKNLEATIRRALELGINHIETARGYGTSEIQLGRVLPRLPRDQMVVQTKIGPKETAKEFLEVFETSMSNLQLDYIDLLGVHGINLSEHIEMCTRKGGTLDAVRQLQKEGRVKHVGFSTHGLTAPIVAAIETGEFDYVNLHWYFVNEVNAAAIEAAKQQDMGVFIISPNEKGGRLFAPTERMKDLCAPLSPMAFNDLWCLCNEQVHTLSLGASCPGDFDEHVRAMELYESREAVTRPIAARIREAAIEVLGEEWWDHWQEGVPDYNDLPSEVNAWEILRLWNWVKVLDLVDFGKMRYNLLGQAGHWFPGNNASRFNRRDMLWALRKSPFQQEIPDRLKEAHTILFEAQKKRLSES